MHDMKTALIVDDDALVLESIDLLLSQAEGFRTIRALGVNSARSDLQQARIDVLVADVILAGSTTGIELCEFAIERHPMIAVVVITADNEVQRGDIPERGIFLRKPFGGTQLLQAIDAALERARDNVRGDSSVD
jgi:DNA-binding NtrC family response regulator